MSLEKLNPSELPDVCLKNIKVILGLDWINWIKNTIDWIENVNLIISVPDISPINKIGSRMGL